MKARILLVEDDLGMSEVARALLAGRGYKVDAASTAEEALDLVRRRPPDLVIADVQLPGLSGLKLCELLRGSPATAGLPIILLTVMGGNADKVRGLRQGADDYLAKPYHHEELLARVEALLRRVQRGGRPEEVLRSGDIAVDVDRREVSVKGRPVRLRRKELELLVFFLRHPGRMLTREHIAASLWPDAVVTANTLTVHVKNLRTALGPAGDRIATVIGEGYKLLSA